MNIRRSETDWLHRALPVKPGGYRWSPASVGMSWTITKGVNRIPVLSGTGYMRPFGIKLLHMLVQAEAQQMAKPIKKRKAT